MIYEPGDVLLYARGGLFNRIIRIKTWSRVSHVEVVAVGGERPMVVAARNGIGVGFYEFAADVDTVLRPVTAFDASHAWRWFRIVNGQAYDWLGLLAFTTAKLQGRDNRAMFCSEFATRYLRAGGIDPFNGYDADGIAPGEFCKSLAFSTIARPGSGVCPT